MEITARSSRLITSALEYIAFFHIPYEKDLSLIKRPVLTVIILYILAIYLELMLATLSPGIFRVILGTETSSFMKFFWPMIKTVAWMIFVAIYSVIFSRVIRHYGYQMKYKKILNQFLWVFMYVEVIGFMVSPFALILHELVMPIASTLYLTYIASMSTKNALKTTLRKSILIPFSVTLVFGMLLFIILCLIFLAAKIITF